METIKTNNNETLNEGVKVVEKLFNDINSATMDIYKKQMDLAAGFYTNLFNLSMGNINGLGQNRSVPLMLANTEVAKWFSNPFVNLSAMDVKNPMLALADKTMKQMIDFNQKLLSPFIIDGSPNKRTNSESMNDEYTKLLETKLKDSKDMLNTLTEAFNKQLESSVENNRKMMEEISSQFSAVMKQNQKLWADMLNKHQAAPVHDEKKEKETHSHVSKKASNGTAAVKK